MLCSVKSIRSSYQFIVINFVSLLSFIIYFIVMISNFSIVFRIHRAALWILGEYCTSVEDIQSLMNEIRNSLGEIPIVDDEMKKAAGEDTEGTLEQINFSLLFFLSILKMYICSFLFLYGV